MQTVGSNMEKVGQDANEMDKGAMKYVASAVVMSVLTLIVV